MNNKKVREIISFYKQNFKAISNQEIYKWRAVRQFQDNWDITTLEFSSMLEKSFARTSNLLDSGSYFPRRMLFESAKKEPEKVRQLFKNLYNEEDNLFERIESFQEGIETIVEKNYPDRKSYQDERAVMVYLCLQYPEIYYLYKFNMFKDFVNQVDFPYLPKKSKEKKSKGAKCFRISFTL